LQVVHLNADIKPPASSIMTIEFYRSTARAIAILNHPPGHIQIDGADEP
jgi:hypothetical protein